MHPTSPVRFMVWEKMQFDDPIIVHIAEKSYVFAVREVISVSPENVSAMLKHQETAWLTLVTCQGFNEESGQYKRRILVRAELVEVRESDHH